MAARILCLQLRQLGDILLTSPVWREIKRAWPEVQLDVLTHPMGRLILKDNPYVAEHICYQEKAGLGDQWRFLRELKHRRYDLVLDFMYNPRSAFYSWMSSSPKRLAFPSRRAFFYTDIVAQPVETDYIVREKFAYLRALGIEPQSEALDLPWFAADAQITERFFAEKAKGPLRVVLSPTHRRAERQWPSDRFASLATQLVRQWGAEVYWVHGPGERDFVANIQALCGEPTELMPPTSFREMAAFFAACHLFVGNSNGPSHVAVASDLPSLQLHGPTLARTWCPCTERHRALSAVEHHAEQRGPMTEISLVRVWNALQEFLPYLQNNAQSRQANGVRMSWN